MASLYVHIPFCHSKCIYCDFYSVAGHRRQREVVEGIIAEYKARRGEIAGAFSTVYFGGGTPSSLDPELQMRLFDALPVVDAEEITIEANPEDITHATADMWRHAGVNRVSMGVQTFNDGVLRRLGRRHTGARATEAVVILREAGINNISIDLIYGLPGVDFDGWRSDLHRAVQLPVTHLSAYSLTFTEGTMLWKLWQRGSLSPINDDDTRRRFDALREITSDAGFEHYEISNFARPGYRSRHNSGYWRADNPWLGLGPSAHSFDGVVRRIGHPSIDRWLDSLPQPFIVEEESPVDLVNDLLVACLRTVDGLSLDSIEPHHAHRLLGNARRFIASGAMKLEENRLKVCPEEWLRCDYYIRELLLDNEN